MAKEEGEKKDTPVVTEKKKPIWILILAVVLVVALFAVKDNWGGVQDILNPPEPAPVIHNLTDADVVLYKFDALSSNKTSNIELWLMNLGEKPAKNITVHVRTRTQNGTVLFDNNISLSTLVLRANETCTGDYTIILPKAKSIHLYHTIEVSWDGGRDTYSKETSF